MIDGTRWLLGDASCMLPLRCCMHASCNQPSASVRCVWCSMLDPSPPLAIHTKWLAVGIHRNSRVTHAVCTHARLTAVVCRLASPSAVGCWLIIHEPCMMHVSSDLAPPCRCTSPANCLQPMLMVAPSPLTLAIILSIFPRHSCFLVDDTT